MYELQHGLCDQIHDPIRRIEWIMMNNRGGCSGRYWATKDDRKNHLVLDAKQDDVEEDDRITIALTLAGPQISLKTTKEELTAEYLNANACRFGPVLDKIHKEIEEDIMKDVHSLRDKCNALIDQIIASLQVASSRARFMMIGA